MPSSLLNRRKFLAASVATISTAALPRMSRAQYRAEDVFTNASLGAYLQGSLKQATFERLVGSTFRVFLRDYKVAYLRLDKVEGTAAGESVSSGAKMRGKIQAAVAPGATESFTLSFTSSSGQFAQGSYLADQASLGRFAVFLVPDGTTGCVATFNYLISAGNPTPATIRSLKALSSRSIIR